MEDEPYPRPNNKLGDTEKVTVDGEEYYRLHISRSHTAFYRVKESESQVHVINIVDIDTAHKMYD